MNNIGYTSDLVIFGIESIKNDNCRELPIKKLSILLVKRDKEPFINKWCLPGGFINNDETSLQAANRILKRETNLVNVYLNHLDVFDDINRDPRGRIISNSYFALIDKNKIKDTISENSKWFDVEINENKKLINIKLTNNEELNIQIEKNIKYSTTNEYSYKLIKNDLAFDHGLIISKGIDTLKNKAENTDIIFNLMPELFTIGELKQVYELLLNKKLINSAFRRIIAKKIEPTEKIIKNGGFRPSILYKYKNKII